MTTQLYTMRRGPGKRGFVHLMQFLRRRLGRECTLVEIGSFTGESTEIAAKFAKKVYAVDPWLTYEEPSGVIASTNMSEAERMFDTRLEPYNNVVKMKMTSEDALQHFENESVDAVYIDGNHAYDFVKFDIASWLPKLQPNGVICGHDFTDEWDGVQKAVTELLGTPDLVFIDSSWLKLKEGAPPLSLRERVVHSVKSKSIMMVEALHSTLRR